MLLYDDECFIIWSASLVLFTLLLKPKKKRKKKRKERERERERGYNGINNLISWFQSKTLNPNISIMAIGTWIRCPKKSEILLVIIIKNYNYKSYFSWNI